MRCGVSPSPRKTRMWSSWARSTVQGNRLLINSLDITIMADDQVVVYHNKQLPLQAFPLMGEIRRHGKLCDVTLKVGDQKFTAHRIVLAATIPYFHAMFTHDMAESKLDEIVIQEIEASALESLVNFAYDGKLQIDGDNVQALLVGANFLNLRDVKDACCDFLKNKLQPCNVLDVQKFAEQLACTTLVDATNRYINKHFVDVARSDQFLLLGVADVVAIIRRDELYIDSEEKVFEAVLAWVKCDTEGRSEHMPELMQYVRMPLLTPQYLTDKVNAEELIRKSLRCRDLLDEARDYHLMPERRRRLRTFRTQPRSCTDVVGLVVAVGGLTSSGDSVSTVEIYDPRTEKWTLSSAMSTLRSRVGVAVLRGQLYAIGGYNGVERLDTVEIFDLAERRWQLVAPMLCKRSALGAAALDGKLYVCGGYDGVTSLDTVECYDTTTNEWTMVTKMTKSRSAAGVEVFDGQIYALGGHDGLSIFDSVECYNNLSGTWTQVAPMLSKRCRLGVASLNGKLYAAGGYDGHVFLKTCECYDPIANRWTYVAPMNVQRSRVALVANCGRLYAIGGYDGQNNLKTMEIYDPAADRWTLGADMCAHEGGVGVGVVPVPPVSCLATAGGLGVGCTSGFASPSSSCASLPRLASNSSTISAAAAAAAASRLPQSSSSSGCLSRLDSSSASDDADDTGLRRGASKD